MELYKNRQPGDVYYGRIARGGYALYTPFYARNAGHASDDYSRLVQHLLGLRIFLGVR